MVVVRSLVMFAGFVRWFSSPVVAGCSDTLILVPGRPVSHDHVPAVPDSDATAALDAALARLRVQGAIFLRGEYTESWAYQSMSARETAAVLVPDAERVVLFHVVSSGRCWVETDDSERRWADPGD